MEERSIKGSLKQRHYLTPGKRSLLRVKVAKIANTEMARKLVKSTFGYETWARTERHRNRLNAIEMGFLTEIENKSRMDRIRIQEMVKHYK